MKDGKFESMAEIEEYLSVDKIECLICGKSYRGLNHHIQMSHKDMSLDEYNIRFGIPLGLRMVGADTRQLMVTASKKTYSENTKVRESLRSGRDKGRTSQVRKPAPTKKALLSEMPALADKMKQVGKLNIRSQIERGTHMTKTSVGKTACHCSKCGVGIEASVNAVITHRDEIMCTRCKSENHQRSQSKTPSYSTPGRMEEYRAAWHQLKRRGNPMPMEEYKRKYSEG